MDNKRSMTAERLEELARKCDDALKSPEYWLDNFLQSEDIADLARCARAWAKVEALLDDGNGYSLDFWKWKGLVRLRTVTFSAKASTVVEAIEAAKETT